MTVSPRKSHRFHQLSEAMLRAASCCLACGSSVTASVPISVLSPMPRPPAVDRLGLPNNPRIKHCRASHLAACGHTVGVIVNAGICGAVSGPHERYQARVMWLLLVAAGMLEAASPIIIARFSWAENRGFAGVRLFKRSASRALSWVRAVDL